MVLQEAERQCMVVVSVPEGRQVGACLYLSISPTTMDLINRTLSLTPLPYLDPALSAFKFIWSDVEQVEVSQRQLEALAQSIAQLLLILDTECRAGREVQVGPSTPLANLSRSVRLVKTCVFTHTSILQATGRHLHVCSESGIESISEASVHQGSKEYPDGGLPSIPDPFG